MTTPSLVRSWIFLIALSHSPFVWSYGPSNSGLPNGPSSNEDLQKCVKTAESAKDRCRDELLQARKDDYKIAQGAGIVALGDDSGQQNMGKTQASALRAIGNRYGEHAENCKEIRDDKNKGCRNICPYVKDEPKGSITLAEEAVRACKKQIDGDVAILEKAKAQNYADAAKAEATATQAGDDPKNKPEPKDEAKPKTQPGKEKPTQTANNQPQSQQPQNQQQQQSPPPQAPPPQQQANNQQQQPEQPKSQDQNNQNNQSAAPSAPSIPNSNDKKDPPKSGFADADDKNGTKPSSNCNGITAESAKTAKGADLEKVCACQPLADACRAKFASAPIGSSGFAPSSAGAGGGGGGASTGGAASPQSLADANDANRLLHEMQGNREGQSMGSLGAEGGGFGGYGANVPGQDSSTFNSIGNMRTQSVGGRAPSSGPTVANAPDIEKRYGPNVVHIVSDVLQNKCDQGRFMHCEPKR